MLNAKKRNEVIRGTILSRTHRVMGEPRQLRRRKGGEIPVARRANEEEKGDKETVLSVESDDRLH